MAHLGTEKVVDLARKGFYWRYMAKHIDHFIRKKCMCIISKIPNILNKAPLVQIDATYSFEMISIDFLHIEKCKGGYEYVLLV